MYFRNIFDHTIYLKKKKKGFKFSPFSQVTSKRINVNLIFIKKKKKGKYGQKKKKNPTCKEHV